MEKANTENNKNIAVHIETFHIGLQMANEYHYTLTVYFNEWSDVADAYRALKEALGKGWVGVVKNGSFLFSRAVPGSMRIKKKQLIEALPKGFEIKSYKDNLFTVCCKDCN